ncbi:MAG TPA: hypothetical protein VFU07_02325 [Candidatus Lumbricidophila sp.]|nr:hypothetical protein [Candidatus Lumbricidophila sp.]
MRINAAPQPGDADPSRPRLGLAHTVLLFLASLLVTTLAVYRAWVIAWGNVVFNDSPAVDPVEPTTDPTMWVTAVLLTAFSLGLFAIAAVATARKMQIAGATFGVLVAIPAAANWAYVTGQFSH